MAKKKKVINLSYQNLSFSEKESVIKIISFNPNTMEVDVSIQEETSRSKKLMKMPFAHLPKELKKVIKPN